YLVRTVNQFSSVEEMRRMLVTVQAQGQGGDASASEAARIAAATGDAVVLAAAMAAQSSGGGSIPGGGRAIRLEGIAEVRQGHKAREAIIRVDGREAVELAIYKEGDANTVATADAVHARLAQIRQQVPPDFELRVIEDQ